MKTTLATTLSLVGVLGAGAAAALVNTSIFDSTPTEAAASSAFIPEAATVDLTLPPSAEVVTATTTVEAPVTAAQSTGTSEAESAAPAPVSSSTVPTVGWPGASTNTVAPGRPPESWTTLPARKGPVGAGAAPTAAPTAAHAGAQVTSPRRWGVGITTPSAPPSVRACWVRAPIWTHMSGAGAPRQVTSVSHAPTQPSTSQES